MNLSEDLQLYCTPYIYKVPNNQFFQSKFFVQNGNQICPKVSDYWSDQMYHKLELILGSKHPREVYTLSLLQHFFWNSSENYSLTLPRIKTSSDISLIYSCCLAWTTLSVVQVMFSDTNKISFKCINFHCLKIPIR